MVDYTQSTGASGTLIIRDLNGKVSFLIKNTQAATYANGKSWSGRINNTNVSGTFSINGVQTITLGTWTVTTGQTVTFTMGATGTGGLGGPTTFKKDIVRATKPPAPKVLGFSEVTHTGFKFAFTSQGTGGSAIIEWEYAVGTNPASPTSTGNVTGTTSGTSVLTGKQPGTIYYGWGRGRNSYGWGPWSARAETRTLPGVKIKANGKWINAVVYVKHNGVWKIATPYLKNDGVWKSTIA